MRSARRSSRNTLKDDRERAVWAAAYALAFREEARTKTDTADISGVNCVWFAWCAVRSLRTAKRDRCDDWMAWR
jgi:hypothetical protein